MCILLWATRRVALDTNVDRRALDHTPIPRRPGLPRTAKQLPSSPRRAIASSCEGDRIGRSVRPSSVARALAVVDFTLSAVYDTGLGRAAAYPQLEQRHLACSQWRQPQRHRD